MIEGTLSYFIREVATILNDPTVSASADGTIMEDRTTRFLNVAQRRLAHKLRDMHVRAALFARKVTLTVNTVDEYAYNLPPRFIGVAMVEDSDGIVYRYVPSRLRYHEQGYVLEYRQSTTGSMTVPVVRFINMFPASSATVYAWVIEEPARMSEGDADWGATDVTFDATPTLAGILIDQDDYYNGAEVACITSDTAAAVGQIRQISDYVAATRVATVAAWTTEPADNDDYSIISGLPRVLWPCIVYDAAAAIALVDSRWDKDDRASIRKERDLSFNRAMEVLNSMAAGANIGARQEYAVVH